MEQTQFAASTANFFLLFIGFVLFCLYEEFSFCFYEDILNDKERTVASVHCVLEEKKEDGNSS